MDAKSSCVNKYDLEKFKSTMIKCPEAISLITLSLKFYLRSMHHAWVILFNSCVVLQTLFIG